MATELYLGISEEGSDDLRLEELSLQLRNELMQTDVESVEPAAGGAVPEGARSPLALLAGALVAQLSDPGKLLSVVRAVVDWLRRDDGSKKRSVHIEIDGDILDLDHVDDETQQRLVDQWIARHATPASAT